MLDGKGRPYFLWDMDMTLDLFQQRLGDSDPVVSGYFHAKLMRQARPDDVFQFTTLRRVRDLWPRIEKHLGQSRNFWVWILERWERIDHGG